MTGLCESLPDRLQLPAAVYRQPKGRRVGDLQWLDGSDVDLVELLKPKLDRFIAEQSVGQGIYQLDRIDGRWVLCWSYVVGTTAMPIWRFVGLAARPMWSILGQVGRRLSGLTAVGIEGKSSVVVPLVDAESQLRRDITSTFAAMAWLETQPDSADILACAPQSPVDDTALLTIIGMLADRSDAGLYAILRDAPTGRLSAGWSAGHCKVLLAPASMAGQSLLVDQGPALKVSAFPVQIDHVRGVDVGEIRLLPVEQLVHLLDHATGDGSSGGDWADQVQLPEQMIAVADWPDEHWQQQLSQWRGQWDDAAARRTFEQLVALAQWDRAMALCVLQAECVGRQDLSARLFRELDWLDETALRGLLQVTEKSHNG